MYAAAINRPFPTTASPRVPVTSALTGWSPASWAAACQRGATLAIRVTSVKVAIIADAVQEPASSATRTGPAVLPTGDRDRPRRDT
jgi:hypothetical protein